MLLFVKAKTKEQNKAKLNIILDYLVFHSLYVKVKK